MYPIGNKRLFMRFIQDLALPGYGYGKCGTSKPNFCPPDRKLFTCNIFIFKQPNCIFYCRR